MISLGLTASTLETGAAIHKKMYGSGTCPLDLAKEKTLIMLK